MHVVLHDGQGESRPDLSLMSTNMKTPRNRQFSLGVGQQITTGLSLNLDFVHQQASNLYVSRALNPFIPSLGQRALTDAYGDITVYESIGRARFHALMSELVYNLQPFRLRAAYTLGWYYSEFDGLGGYAELDSYQMQRTTGDERQRLVLSGIASLPREVTLSAMAVFATPRPFGVTLGYDANDNGLFNDDWPDGRRTMHPGNRWENMYRTIDLRVAKAFALGTTEMTLVAEAFNVFNWTNWSGFSGRMYDADENPLTSFGEPSGALAPRQGQVGLRFAF
jgi:hypothetical protein